jgi:hypothetical protein
MKDLLDSDRKVKNIFDKNEINFNIDDRLKILINDEEKNFDGSIIKEWARKNNATEVFIDLWDIYNNLYKSCGNINPVVAYIQAAIETDFGNFNGDLKESFNNPYGVKEFKYDAEGVLSEEYTKFTSWQEGIEAHLDHLALYFGAEGYPKEKSKDTRHFYYLYGICSDILDLQDKWTIKKEYSNRILDELKNIYCCNNEIDNDLNVIEKLELENKLLKDKINNYDEMINNVKCILNKKI